MNERWVNLKPDEAELWSSRANVAAAKLGAVTGVADFGCGWMTLERHLASGVLYVPIDLVARDARTIVCDFDTDELPRTQVPAAAGLGVLGYLKEPARFMRQLADRHDRAVLSYKATDALWPEEDRSLAGLVNAFSRRELSALFEIAGWTIEDIFDFDTRQDLWTLAR